MTIMKTDRCKTLSVKMTDDEFKDYKKLQKYGINVSAMLRAFINKTAKEISKFEFGSGKIDYIMKLENTLEGK